MKMKYNNDINDQNTSGIDFAASEREALRNKIIHQRLATPDSLNVPRPIEPDEWKSWHSSVYKFHDLYNNSELTKCIERPRRQQEAKALNASAKGLRFWANPAADASMTKACFDASELWIAQTPAFDSTLQSNRAAMGEELSRLGLIPDSPQVLQEIFVSLCLRGALELIPENDPRAPKDAPSTGLTGSYLQRYLRENPWLLTPYVPESEEAQEERRIAEMDSESYRREFLKPEVSQREKDFIEKTRVEFLQKNPTFDEDVDGAWEILTDYLTEHQLGFRLSELNLAFAASQDKLKAIDALWTTTKETEYRAGISSLVDKRLPKAMTPTKEISIEEGRKKTWTHLQIRQMTAQQYQEAIDTYGQSFLDAVDAAF